VLKLSGRATVAAALLGAAVGAEAQSVGNDASTMWRDARWIVASPARASTSDLKTTALLTAGAAGLLVLADDRVHEWLQTDPWPAQLLAPFRENSPVSIAGRTWFFLLPLSATMYLAGHVLGSSDLREAGTGCATANLTTTLTRTALARFVVNRDRPGMDTGPFRFQLFAFGSWDQRSFPGGHASNIMSCASYFNHRFDLGVAGPALWGLATGVGLARIVDEAHWTSDTFVGMTYGYAVGRAAAQRGLERGRIVPAERSLQPGLGVGFRISF
jgi:membrane-associated phospholipid phosphatase